MSSLFWQIGFDYGVFYIFALLMTVICREGHASDVKIFMIHTHISLIRLQSYETE